MKIEGEDLEMLVDTGRHMASEWLQTAIRSAKDQEQLRNHTAALYVASVHIVATELYNRVLHGGQTNAENTIAQVVKEIRTEFKFLMESDQGETTLLGPGEEKPE